MGKESAYKWVQKHIRKVDSSIGFKGNQARAFLKKAGDMALSRSTLLWNLK